MSEGRPCGEDQKRRGREARRREEPQLRAHPRAGGARRVHRRAPAAPQGARHEEPAGRFSRRSGFLPQRTCPFAWLFRTGCPPDYEKLYDHPYPSTIEYSKNVVQLELTLIYSFFFFLSIFDAERRLRARVRSPAELKRKV